MLRYFAAITPPPELSEKVLQFRRENLSEHQRPRLEPHVKVKSQIGLDPVLLWLPTMEDIAAKTKPFTIHLEEPQFYGNNLLVMPVVSPELDAMHSQLIKVLAPPKVDPDAYYEQESIYVPVITIAQGEFGSYWASRKLRNKARKQLGIFKSFEASELRLYEADIMDYSYHVAKVLPLGRRMKEGEAWAGEAYAAAA